MLTSWVFKLHSKNSSHSKSDPGVAVVVVARLTSWKLGTNRQPHEDL